MKNMANSRFTYSRWSPQADVVDTHHILFDARVGLNPSLLRFGGVAFLYLLLLLLLQGNSIAIMLWSFPLGGLLLKLLHSKTVEKESVLVMPAFGVQLQTHYLGGKVIRRFIPVDKILKPVLVEHVTPVTCYWSLCLVIREEAEMTSVFKGLRPPVKMLVPIWKALREATNKEESSKASTQYSQ